VSRIESNVSIQRWCISARVDTRRRTRTHGRTNEWSDDDDEKNTERRITTTIMAKTTKKMSAKKLLVGAVAMSAMTSGAHAFTKYSEMTEGITVTTAVGSGSACATDMVAKAGADSITVAWSGFTPAADSTLTVKLCYDDSELPGKPWRKFNDVVTKNKQCKQTVVESAALQTGIDPSDGSVEIKLPRNIAPAKYSIQVLESTAADGYTTYGQTADACAFTVDTYDRRPQALVGTMSFFIAFSIVAGTAGYMVDSKRQSAAAAAYA